MSLSSLGVGLDRTGLTGQVGERAARTRCCSSSGRSCHRVARQWGRASRTRMRPRSRWAVVSDGLDRRTNESPSRRARRPWTRVKACGLTVSGAGGVSIEGTGAESAWSRASLKGEGRNGARMTEAAV